MPKYTRGSCKNMILWRDKIGREKMKRNWEIGKMIDQEEKLIRAGNVEIIEKDEREKKRTSLN